MSASSPLRLWLLVSADVSDEDLAVMPAHWGLLRACPDKHQVAMLRKASGSGRLPPEHEASSLYAVGTRSLSGMLPRLGRGVPDSTEALLRADVGACEAPNPR